MTDIYLQLFRLDARITDGRDGGDGPVEGLGVEEPIEAVFMLQWESESRLSGVQMRFLSERLDPSLDQDTLFKTPIYRSPRIHAG